VTSSWWLDAVRVGEWDAGRADVPQRRERPTNSSDGGSGRAVSTTWLPSVSKVRTAR
jgi:hypothetical protein